MGVTVRGEQGEEVVGGEVVAEGGREGDAGGVGGAPAQCLRGAVGVRGEEGSAGGAEGVVLGRRAVRGQRAEGIKETEPVEDEQAALGAAAGGEGKPVDLTGGQHPVLVHHAHQPLVARGEAGGERGQRDARRCAGAGGGDAGDVAGAGAGSGTGKSRGQEGDHLRGQAGRAQLGWTMGPRRWP